jgi:hypothetical protein
MYMPFSSSAEARLATYHKGVVEKAADRERKPVEHDQIKATLLKYQRVSVRNRFDSCVEDILTAAIIVIAAFVISILEWLRLLRSRPRTSCIKSTKIWVHEWLLAQALASLTTLSYVVIWSSETAFAKACRSDLIKEACHG